MTNAQKRETRQLAKAGWKPKDIAEEVGCSVATARMYVKIFGNKK